MRALIKSIAIYLAQLKYSRNTFLRKFYNAIFLFSENFLFNIEDKNFNKLIEIKKKNNQKYRIFIIPFWGKAYTDAFFNYFLPSLFANNNLPWLAKNYEISIDLYLDKKVSFYKRKYPLFNELISKYDVKYYELSKIENHKKNFKNPLSKKILSAYLHHAKLSLSNNSTSINFAADLILPNNYLKNFIKISLGKPYCYTHPHIRVKKDTLKILNKIKKNNLISINPRELTKIGINNMGYSFLKQNDLLEFNITSHGFSWRNISNTLSSVTPGVLGTLSFNFIPEDIIFIENLSSWSEHDREIPKYLLTSNRMKSVCSSNLLILLEVYLNKELNQNDIKLLENQYNDISKGKNFSSRLWNTKVCSYEH